MAYTYKVMWAVEVEAETDVQAVSMARAIQRGPGPHAFLVYQVGPATAPAEPAPSPYLGRPVEG